MSDKQYVVDFLRALPHARDVQDYLIAMAQTITGKKKPSADYHNLNRASAIFVDRSDLETVVNMIRDVFREKGYRTPWEIEDDLIRKIQPGIPEEAIRIANRYAASMLIPDTMAAYLQKPCVPLTMGLGALYNQTTGKPVSVIEIDFSNMRGTNNHNARLLSIANGTDFDESLPEAEAITDEIAFIIAQTIKQKPLASLQANDGGNIIGLRTGGDELRLVIPDVEIGQVESLLPDIHEAIETITASVGHHDHAHTKLDSSFRGFGAAAAVFPLGPEGDSGFKKQIREADAAISKVKERIGQGRIGNPHYREIKPVYSMDDDLYSNPEKARAYLDEVREFIHKLKSAIVPDRTHMEDPSDMVSPEDVVDLLQPDHFLTRNMIQMGFCRRLSSDLEEKGIQMTPEQKRLLSIKATKFPAMDYATGTLSDCDCPAMMGAALKVVDHLNKATGNDFLPIVLGVDLHNIAGLNNSLGHEKANEVMHKFVHNILIPALGKEGVSKENIVLSHSGGGKFLAVIQPVIFDPDGFQREVDPALSRARSIIGEATAEWSKREFSDILNPREEYRPYENGITTTLVVGTYKDKKGPVSGLWHGGAVVSHIKGLLEDAIEEKRRGYKISASPCTPGEGAHPK